MYFKYIYAKMTHFRILLEMKDLKGAYSTAYTLQLYVAQFAILASPRPASRVHVVLTHIYRQKKSTA